MFLDCFGYVSLMFLGCSKDSLDMFDVGSKHVLKDVSVVFRYASEMFETCFRNVSETL